MSLVEEYTFEFKEKRHEESVQLNRNNLCVVFMG